MRFCLRLAAGSVRKNRKLYLPYLLASSLMVCMYYILVLIKDAGFVAEMQGGSDLQFLLELGSRVILLFAVLFLFYTNAFLIRSRKKEFGLYSVLGMSRTGILKLYFLETVLISVLTVCVGIVTGICFSKLAELLLAAVIDGEVNYRFTVSLPVVGRTAALFAAIELVIFVYCALQITKATAVSLLKSENLGEKPPKANWFLGLAGLVLLGTAYYIAVTIGHPVEALVTFFAAVLMVILATYLLFISGSALLCRILQKKKSFYYKPENFVTVSTMAYRMKRNGAGLASICIIATMVLVMISSSACLYFGAEDGLRGRYPRDIISRIDFTNVADANESNMQPIRDMMCRAAQHNGADLQNRMDYRDCCISGLLKDDVLQVYVEGIHDFSAASYNDIVNVHFIPLEDYNRMCGSDIVLGAHETLVYPYRVKALGDTLTICDTTYDLTQRIDSFAVSGDASANVLPSLFLVVPDLQKAIAPLADLTLEDGAPVMEISWYYGFDTTSDATAQANTYKEIITNLSKAQSSAIYSYSCDNMWMQRSDYFSTFGGLFFIGILLSVVFLVAAVLIIYYKQVSEGYEDQARFDIMQRVGMTKKEIRKSINSQMLTVFFLPLFFAAMHLAFAFPLIRKLLLLFSVNNLPLLLATNAASVLAFALFYTIVYRGTSNSYFNIVSGAKE